MRKQYMWKRHLIWLLAAALLFVQPAAAFGETASSSSSSVSEVVEEAPAEEPVAEEPAEPEPEEQEVEEPAEEERVSPLANVNVKRLSDGEIKRLLAGERGELTGDEIRVLKAEQARRAEEARKEAREAEKEEAAAREAEQEAKKSQEAAGNEEDSEENKEDASGESEGSEKKDEKPVPKTNSELVALQKIVQAPKIIEDFRFWTVSKVGAFAKDKTEIYEKEADDARVVGTLEKDGLCYILKDASDAWYYVESGEVRGFVKKEALAVGDAAKSVLRRTHDADEVGFAKKAVEPEENEAYTWLRATVEQTVIRKDWALAVKDGVMIREEKNEESRAVGEMKKGALCYIVADRGAEWIYVESADVRGFVKSEELKKDAAPFKLSEQDIQALGTSITELRLSEKETEALEAGLEAFRKLREEMEKEQAKEPDIDAILEMELKEGDTLLHDAIAAAGEKQFATAEQLVEPEENKATYYTHTSPFAGVPGGKERASLLAFARQFIGNRYIWGGTSLVEGADCSGFVQSIFAQYGYYLPRTSREQALHGVQIPVNEAEPGDLIFYAKGGRVYHVVIYAGDGKTIESKSRRAGVVIDDVNMASAVWATRVLEDKQISYAENSDITEKNAAPTMYGDDLGKFKISWYCGCKECNAMSTEEKEIGTRLVEGRTIAADPDVIKPGTRVIIGGHIYTAEDGDRNLRGNHIEIYVDDHDVAEELGVTYSGVHLAKESK